MTITRKPTKFWMVVLKALRFLLKLIGYNYAIFLHYNKQGELFKVVLRRIIR